MLVISQEFLHKPEILINARFDKFKFKITDFLESPKLGFSRKIEPASLYVQNRENKLRVNLAFRIG